MIAAELKIILGRRGMFWVSLLLPIFVVVTIVTVATIMHLNNPDHYRSIGGGVVDTSGSIILTLIFTVLAVILGARAGSYDASQQVLRYRIMTGVGRWRLYVTRIVATLLTCLITFTPAVVLFVAATFLPHAADEGVRGGDLGRSLVTMAANVVIYVLISLGVGTLTNSTGPAVALGIVFAFALAPMTALIGLWSKEVANLTLPVAQQQAFEAGSTSVVVTRAAFVLVIWVAAFVAVGWMRLRRSEV